MKKILITFVAGAILAVTASADFARLEMGAGAWQQTPSGYMSYKSVITGIPVVATDTSKETQENTGYIWLLIKHPVPIIPNIRLEYVNVKNSGVARGKFEDFEAPETLLGASTKLEMTQYDIIPYYNLFDNLAWTTLDIGVDIKVVEVDYEASNVISNITGIGMNYSENKTIAIPLAYARVRVEIPGTNIGLEADGKYVSYDGSTIYDARAKIDYTLGFIPVVQPAIEIGYRVQKFDLSYDGDVAGSTAKMDMDFSGLYAGMMLRF